MLGRAGRGAGAEPAGSGTSSSSSTMVPAAGIEGRGARDRRCPDSRDSSERDAEPAESREVPTEGRAPVDGRDPTDGRGPMDVLGSTDGRDSGVGRGSDGRPREALGPRDALWPNDGRALDSDLSPPESRSRGSGAAGCAALEARRLSDGVGSAAGRSWGSFARSVTSSVRSASGGRAGSAEGDSCVRGGGGACASPRINARRVSVNGSVILSKSMVSYGDGSGAGGGRSCLLYTSPSPRDRG